MSSPEYSDTEFERIARQLAREAGSTERAEFERSLADPVFRARFDELSVQWNAVSLTDGIDVDAAWSRFQSRLAGAAQPGLTATREHRWWRNDVVLLRAAAVGIAILGAGILWARIADPDRSHSASEPPVAAAALPAPAVTAAGERRSFDLPDGTSVVLGAASELRTVSGYGDRSREVELTGEAEFQVTHDASRPFRVRASGAVIEDLGTRFVVRALVREPLRVAVSEGSVSLRRTSETAGRQVVLEPRDVAVLGDTGDAIVSRGVDVERYAAWTTGRLVFNHTQLREAIVDLERWYDVDFDVTDAGLLGRHLDVEFSGQAVDEVLRILGPMLQVTFEREGRTVRVAAPVRTGLIPSPATQVGGGGGGDGA